MTITDVDPPRVFKSDNLRGDKGGKEQCETFGKTFTYYVYLPCVLAILLNAKPVQSRRYGSAKPKLVNLTYPLTEKLRLVLQDSAGSGH